MVFGQIVLFPDVGVIREGLGVRHTDQLFIAARFVFDITQSPAEVVLLEGKKREALLGLIRDDKAISILVLASGQGRDGPGPLVAAVAAGGANAFPIPVTIVPGTLNDAEIDALA